MNAVALKNAIDQAYTAIEKLALQDTRAYDLLRKAFRAAHLAEKAHRKSVGHSSARVSIDYAAKYFILKWFYDIARAPESPKDWLEAATIRLDVLYSYALAEALWSKNPEALAMPPWLNIVDYARDIIGSAQ